MKDKDKTKAQLINELEEMRQQLIGLEAKASDRKRAEAALQKAHDELDQRVTARTTDLARVNEELNRELNERRQAEEALQKSEEVEHCFKERLKTLHEVSNALSKANTFDNLCRRAVELGRSRLGFDRLGLWFVDEDPNFVVGTFGVDENGNIRDERSQRLSSDANSMQAQILTRKERRILLQDVPVFNDKLEVIGQGDLACAAIWDGEKVIGVISTDNLLLRQPITEHECELLTLYASTLGHLCSRVRAEEQLHESNRRLEETLAELKAVQQQIIQQERLRGIGQMASGIAHNFNNALMPILGFSELLLNYPQTLDDKEKVTKYLQMMNTAAQGAAATVSRLRGFYRRQDAGEISQPIDLNSLVLQTIDLTQPKWKDEAQRNNININIEKELHEIPLITGDEAELRDVLTNLIFNAVDAMPQGGTVTFRTRVDDDKSAVLEVCDMGVGMTEEARRHCLDPFFSTKGEHGAGLGLAVVYGAVQRHGGEIDIESELGVGTTIIIRVPVRS